MESAATMTMSWPAPPRPAGQTPAHGGGGRSLVVVPPQAKVGLWHAESWRELLYAVINLPLTVVFFSVIVALLASGAGLTVVYVGVAILMAAMAVARAAAATFRTLGRGLLGVPVTDPLPRTREGSGLAAVVWHVLGDRQAWKAVAFVVSKLVMAPCTFAVAIAMYSGGAGAVTYPIWRPFLPLQQGSDGTWHRGTQLWNGMFVDTWPTMSLLAAVGAVMLLAAPFAVHGLLAADRALIRGLLGGRPPASAARSQQPVG